MDKPRRRHVKQDPSEVFDPLDRTRLPLGSKVTGGRDRRRRAEREALQAELRVLAARYGLTERGTLPEGEQVASISREKRDRIIAKLTGYPVIPDGELALLNDLLRHYGLPVERLDPDVAAFVIRRAQYEFKRFATLQRKPEVPMFTPQELLELLKEMRLRQFALAKLLQPDNPEAAYNAIQRWLHDLNYPRGVLAMRVNRLIDLHVRNRRRPGGFPAERAPGELSANPETVVRRNRLDRARARLEADRTIPLSTEAKRVRLPKTPGRPSSETPDA